MEKIKFFEYTNPGKREKNEDTCGSAFNNGEYCFVVADGLGGHGGGEIASQLAVQEVLGCFLEEGWSDQFFDHAFNKAQDAILAEQEKRLAPSRMKTTMVVLVVSGEEAYWAHVGDSRLYYIKGGKIKKRTIDHSVPQQLALSREIKESEIRHHPDRNRVLRVLGIRGEKPRFECGDPLKIKGDTHFYLCTDGFWELIEEKDMEMTLKASGSLEDWVKKQEEIVLKNGEGTEMDNYTCIVVNVKGPSLFGR